YDFGGVGETLFIVTEYVEGKTLRKLVQEKGISLVQAVEIAVQIAEGLVAAHEAGIIHRDLKLENFILRPDNYVKILDFGLAKPVLGLVGNDKTNNFSDGFATGAGVILGTPNYMSPEQAKGKEIDARSDIFSFGAVLYELLAHHTAFEADNDIQTLFQVAFQEPEPLPSTIPLQLRKIVELALKKFVEARYQSMRELLSDLKEVQAELVDDRPEMEFKNSDTKGISPSPTSRRSFGIGSGAGMSGISSGKTGKLRSGTTERPSLTEPNYDYFVGRDREMMLLQSEFIRFQSGKGRPVLILGDTGTGKTLIVDNFKQWATKKGAVAVSSAFYNYGGSILQPYQTFLNIVHQALGIKVSQNVVSGLVMELWQPILSEVKARFGIELPYNFSTTQEGQEDKWKTFEIFREIFFQLALRQPLILIFDDLHAADALSFELIGYLLRNPSTSPVMMIFAADSQEASQAGSGLREWMVAQSKYFSFETIRLKPFNSKEIRKMLDAIFSRIEIADSEVSHLCEATGGNPYYLTEVVRLLVADGKIEQEEGWWKCKSLTNFELPASVGMAVQQQLKACQQDLYELLSQAAVLGESFRFETLAEISGKTDKELEKLLSDAVKAGLFREEAANQGDDYSFSNTLIRRVLYDELSRRQRRKLHLTSATAIEEVFKGKLNRFLGQLTYHLSAAGEWRQAYDYGVRAIDQSWERNAWSELIRLAQMVEEAAEAIGQEEGDGIEPSGVMQIKLRAATAFMRQGKLMQAKEKAEEV
ncbi:MAG: protein kinase, partial [Blastocatellia bacterium]|nr:protein kinase [Blastocatellia bacterium]